MLVFSPCKINLGLNIVEKRPDGFHNIETVFYPINWEDAIEVIVNEGGNDIELSFSGLKIEGEAESNIVFKAFQLIKARYPVPNIKVYIHKVIPMGAGLGGGSSNAACFINLMDKRFALKMSIDEKLEIAKQLGSDCAFFIEQKPVYAKEKGDVFEPIQLSLKGYYCLMVYPNVHSNTKLAYQGVIPRKPERSVKNILETMPIESWKDLLVNDFETSVFKAYPEIEVVKNQLYENGAVYASMSGSGSTVFGLFKNEPKISFPKNYSVFCELLS